MGGMDMIKNRLERLIVELDDMNQSAASPEGMFTFQELQGFMQEEIVKAKFGILGIEPEDAWSLFKLIDVDQTNLVDTDSFLEGCIKLRGEATRLDLELLTYTFNFHMDNLNQFMEHVVMRLQEDVASVALDGRLAKEQIDANTAKVHQLEVEAAIRSGGMQNAPHEQPQKAKP